MEIDLLQYKSRLRISDFDGKRMVFDPVRRKYVAFTPEESVRQLFIIHLAETHGVPISRMSTERQVGRLGDQLRFDLSVYDREGNVRLLVECKSFKVPLSEYVTHQIARYNQSYMAEYLCITNGLESYFWVHASGRYHLVEQAENLTFT